jgi:hypothetical protein
MYTNERVRVMRFLSVKLTEVAEGLPPTSADASNEPPGITWRIQTEHVDLDGKDTRLLRYTAVASINADPQGRTYMLSRIADREEP